jgi:dTDP-4-dehydrorhamnose reductase
MKGRTKILVLGATGMLGHKLMQRFSGRFEVTGTVRAAASAYARHPVLGGLTLVGDISAEDGAGVERLLGRFQPDVVVNCIGVVKQLPQGKDPLPSIAVNALFPHRLAGWCRTAGSRLIHISTDCVFSGRQGRYREDDPADAADLYGRTKLLGEVEDEHCVTIRTSLIGRELETFHGLIEWFLRHERQTVSGYTRAIFSGFTTNAFAEIVERVITDHPRLAGVWHVASEPISKFDLLSLVKKVYGLEIEIKPDDRIVCDRSLDASRFRQATGLTPPAWPEMIERMAHDKTIYGTERRTHAD